MTCVVLASAACEEVPQKRWSPPPPSPRVTSTPDRLPQRDRPRVVIEATGVTRDRLQTAISDLKRIQVWSKLADRLYAIELDSRSGIANVPEDGHLADAYYTGILDGGGGGTVCDVMFFPSAVTADLARWRDYYARGLAADVPPTVRAFYGSLVAHELAHCRPGPRGEDVARAWEDRVRDALGAGI